MATKAAEDGASYWAAWTPPFSKGQLMELQGSRCYYCGQPIVWPLPEGAPHAETDGTLDHVRALARGGSWWGGNMVMACRRCNKIKSRFRWDYLRDALRFLGVYDGEMPALFGQIDLRESVVNWLLKPTTEMHRPYRPKQ